MPDPRRSSHKCRCYGENNQKKAVLLAPAPLTVVQLNALGRRPRDVSHHADNNL